jgi:hypothetical protein
MSPLIALAIGIGGLSAIREEVRRFERDAATDISAKLQGVHREVAVRAKVGPEAAFGDIHSVRIEARRFTTHGLPLFTEPQRSRKGLVRTLHLDLREFELSGLGIRRLQATLSDSRFDFSLAMRKRQIRLSHSGTGPAEVVVDAEALRRFILGKYPEIKSAMVTIDRDKVIVEGYGEFLLLSANFWIAARLEVGEGSQVNLTFPRILIDGRVADPVAGETLVRALNPIVDLDRDLDLHGALRLDRVQLRDGLLRAWGSLRIPDLPAPTQDGRRY